MMLRQLFFFGVIFIVALWVYLFFTQPLYSRMSRSPKYYMGFTYQECIQFPAPLDICHSMFLNNTGVVTFHDCYKLGYDEQFCYLLSNVRTEL